MTDGSGNETGLQPAATERKENCRNVLPCQYIRHQSDFMQTQFSRQLWPKRKFDLGFRNGRGFLPIHVLLTLRRFRPSDVQIAFANLPTIPPIDRQR